MTYNISRSNVAEGLQFLAVCYEVGADIHGESFLERSVERQ